MNELQLALLGAGVVAVAAVWVYNLLQERKYRKHAETVFRGEHADVLASKPARGEPSVVAPDAGTVSIGRREPVLSGDADNVAESARQADDLPSDGRESVSANDSQTVRIDPQPDTATDATVEESAAATARETGPDELLPWVDLLADCAVCFSAPAPVTGAGLWAAQSSWKGGLGKPIHMLGRNDVRGPWNYVAENSPDRYSHWLVALKLVDRSGPVSDAGVARFIDGLQQIGRHLNVEIALPARSEILMRAQDLDRFCASVDIQFSLSVVSSGGGPFVGTKLRGVCEAAGLILESDGLYHYRNAAGECEFTLGNLGNESFDSAAMSSLATHGVSLTIDVPRVTDGAAAFNRMVLVARQLAQGLGGTLVDANRVALADPVIATIRSKITEVQQVLHKAGIVPGSPRALRLFS